MFFLSGLRGFLSRTTWRAFARRHTQARPRPLTAFIFLPWPYRVRRISLGPVAHL